MNEKMTRRELADKIAETLDCTAKVWEKDNKVRVYLSHRGKAYGFVEITKQGVALSLTGYATNQYASTINKIAKEIAIDEPDELITGTGVRGLTNSEIDKSIDAPRSSRRHNDDEWHFGAADEESF